jgi:hypothetical protein
MHETSGLQGARCSLLYPIVWNGSSQSMVRTVPPPVVGSPYVSSDGTLRARSSAGNLATTLGYFAGY